jgi:hypothetical protein
MLASQGGALYSATMLTPSPSQVCRIGTLAVRPPLSLPTLRGLLRHPTAETADAFTLEFQMVGQPDWSPTLGRGGDRFVKALGAHWCQIDFPARHATIRFRADLDRTAQKSSIPSPSGMPFRILDELERIADVVRRMNRARGIK